MKKLSAWKSPFKSLSINVFLIIIVFLLIPIYISFILVKMSYENYIQQTLSNQLIENIKRGEDDFYQAVQKIANISNVFIQDRELIAVLTDETSSYYERNQHFDRLVQTLSINNLFDLENIKITMFDTQNQAYANWNLNFNDYRFVLEQDWVRQSMSNRGHISWNLFSPSFVLQEKEQYISLARSLFYPVSTGSRIATFIISINQKEINAILSRYVGADFVYVCSRDTMRRVFALTPPGQTASVDQDNIKNLLRKIEGESGGGLLCELNGIRYLLSHYTLAKPWSYKGEPLVVLYFTNYQRVTDDLSRFSRDINFGMLVFVVLLVAIMAVISYTIARPIRLLDKKINQYTRTRQISTIDTNRSDEIGDLNRTFLDMEIRINELFDKLRQESEIREQYHFQALRAQINPHFLFNTLNTIRWMAVIRKADNIVDTINALSKILEYSMQKNSELVTLREELDILRSYMHIQNYRYGEDWEVHIEIEPGLEDYRVVKFILQPIVENVFLHAFKNSSRKKIIMISGRREEHWLKLFVQDNGDGISPRKILELGEELAGGSRKKTTGIGLSNVNERIKTAYGEIFGLKLNSAAGSGTVVEYTLPLIKGDTDEETHGS